MSTRCKFDVERIIALSRDMIDARIVGCPVRAFEAQKALRREGLHVCFVKSGPGKYPVRDWHVARACNADGTPLQLHTLTDFCARTGLTPREVKWAVTKGLPHFKTKAGKLLFDAEVAESVLLKWTCESKTFFASLLRGKDWESKNANAGVQAGDQRPEQDLSAAGDGPPVSSNKSGPTGNTQNESTDTIGNHDETPTGN